MTITNVDKLTDQARELYDNYSFGNFSYDRSRDKYEPLLKNILTAANPDTKVYDIGCGSGYWMKVYQEAGIHKKNIIGIDLAPGNVAALKANGFKAFVGDVLALDVPNSQADLTVCMGVIHHTKDPFLAFSELVRITKPGGLIYLSVYNKWHPYYYIVHKATAPIRYSYWHWSKRTLDIIYPIAALFFQPLAYLVLGSFMDKRSGRIMFMDQVMTPRAELFSSSILTNFAKRSGCNIVDMSHNRYGLMLASVMVKGKN